MSVPNQKVVVIGARTARNKNNLYATLNLNALQEAMNDLDTASAIKMWLYFNKNQEGYHFDLSRKDCESWGIKKDSYYKGTESLIEKGYLVPTREGSNCYTFYEKPLSQKKNRESEDCANWFGENQKSCSGKENRLSEKTERNNTSNTDILQNKTIATDKGSQRNQVDADCWKYKEDKNYLGF